MGPTSKRSMQNDIMVDHADDGESPCQQHVSLDHLLLMHHDIDDDSVSLLSKSKKSPFTTTTYSSTRPTTTAITTETTTANYGTASTCYSTQNHSEYGATWDTTQPQCNNSNHDFAYYSSDRRRTHQKRRLPLSVDCIRERLVPHLASLRQSLSRHCYQSSSSHDDDRKDDDDNDDDDHHHHQDDDEDLIMNHPAQERRGLATTTQHLSWKVVAGTLISMFIAIVAAYFNNNNATVQHNGFMVTPYGGLLSAVSPASDLLPPQWEWDRNVNFPTPSSTPVAMSPPDPSSSPPPPPAAAGTKISSSGGGKRLSLIAVVTSEQPIERLVDVSSRVNRAYARQWHMDYTDYYAAAAAAAAKGFVPSSSSSSSSFKANTMTAKSCFDKAFVLKTMVESITLMAQEGEEDDVIQNTSSSSSFSHSVWSSRLPSPPQSPQVPYDTLVLLPPDAIILDLDQNIVDTLLPCEKLVAISGWNQTTQDMISSSGVVLFNLKHKLASSVAELWWEQSRDPAVLCGATNGLDLLVDVISSVLVNKHHGMEPEGLGGVIEPIREHSKGAVGDQSIKVLPETFPGNRMEYLLTHLEESSETLQQTAASVCYRFYPKCEVVP